MNLLFCWFVHIYLKYVKEKKKFNWKFKDQILRIQIIRNSFTKFLVEIDPLSEIKNLLFAAFFSNKHISINLTISIKIIDLELFIDPKGRGIPVFIVFNIL